MYMFVSIIKARDKEQRKGRDCEQQRVDGSPLQCLNLNPGLVVRECELQLCE